MEEETKKRKPRFTKDVLLGLGIFAKMADSGCIEDYLDLDPNQDVSRKKEFKKARETLKVTAKATAWIKGMMEWKGL